MSQYGGAKELLLCCILMGVLAAPEWIKGIEYAWKRSWLGYSLVLVGTGFFFWFSWHLPPSGYAITAMAVVAGVMALRPEIGGREKWLWFALLLAFMVVEIRAINQDRIDQTTKFGNIAAGLKTAIDNSTIAINGIKEVIQEDRTHFDETMEGITSSVKAQTGGDSFAYITFTPEPGIIKFNNFPVAPGPQFLVSITSHGKYPLREIHATMMDDGRRLAAMEEYNKHPDGDWMKAVESGDTRYQYPYLRPQSSEGPSGDVELLGMYPFPKGDSDRLSIAFSSLNGYWNETLHLGRVNGTWHQCLSVMGPTVKQATNPFIYCDSGWPEGRALAEKDWPHVKRPSLHQ